VAKARKSPCIYCDASIGMVAFCTRCGKPTEWATHDQRVEYELRQWGKSPRAAKPGKAAALVSVREVAEATADRPSPLLRSTPTKREEMKVRKVALHPMAAKVRRAQAQRPAGAEPTESRRDDILPAPRQKKMSLKRHERPEAPATVAADPMPEAKPATPDIEKAPVAKAAPKPTRKPTPKAPAKAVAAKKAPAKKIDHAPGAKKPAKRAHTKMPAAQEEVVIDIREPKPAEAPLSSDAQMLALMERQVELLGEVVRRLSALEKDPERSNANDARAEAATNGSGHKTRRFWFAKR
jgi:hypothetical protein